MYRFFLRAFLAAALCPLAVLAGDSPAEQGKSASDGPVVLPREIAEKAAQFPNTQPRPAVDRHRPKVNSQRQQEYIAKKDFLRQEFAKHGEKRAAKLMLEHKKWFFGAAEYAGLQASDKDSLYEARKAAILKQ